MSNTYLYVNMYELPSWNQYKHKENTLKIDGLTLYIWIVINDSDVGRFHSNFIVPSL